MTGTLLLSTACSESKEVSSAKRYLSLTDDLVKNEALMIYKDDFAHEPLTQEFIEAYPSADVECHDLILEGQAAKTFEKIRGYASYSKVCEFYVKGEHLANIEFMYEGPGGTFLGIVESQLMFEQT
ncbi:MAG: hypothetical protein AAFR18_11855 [Cyanobacteria bacterium J06627_32]